MTVNVGQGGNNFSPNMVTIHIGDTVQWSWVGGFHSTTSGTCTSGYYGGCSPDGLWDSGQHSPSYTFSRKFTATGSFPYYCSVHLSSMTGTVQVMP